jgi:hypothetical protein
MLKEKEKTEIPGAQYWAGFGPMPQSDGPAQPGKQPGLPVLRARRAWSPCAERRPSGQAMRCSGVGGYRTNRGQGGHRACWRAVRLTVVRARHRGGGGRSTQQRSTAGRARCGRRWPGEAPEAWKTSRKGEPMVYSM